MYISNVKISNYRNLRNIDVELAQTVTIIGSNNSGKSNLLKAITLPFLADEIAYVGKNLTWFDINNSAKNDYYQFLIDNKESILTDKVTLEDFKKQIPKIKIEVNIILKKKELYYVKELGYEISEGNISYGLYYEFAPANDLDFYKAIKGVLMSEEINSKTVNELKLNLLPIELYKYSIGVPNRGSISYDILKQFKYTSLMAERDEFSKSNEKLGSKSLVKILQAKLKDGDKIEVEKEYSRFFDTLKKITNIDSLINWQEYSELENASDFFQKINILPNMPAVSSIFNSVRLGYDSENLSMQGLGQRNLILLMVLINSLIEKDSDAVFNILTVEEPEAHLCINNIRLVASFIKAITSKNGDLQLFYSTHNTELIDKLKLKNVILMSGGNAYSIKSEFNDEEINYLSKNPNLDLFKLFYAKKCILVEGLTEELFIRSYLDSKKELNDIEVISFHKGFKRIIDLWLKINSGSSNRLGIVRDYDDEPAAKKEHEVYNKYPEVCVKTTRAYTLEPEIVNTNGNYEILKEKYGEKFGWNILSKEQLSDDWRKNKSYAMLEICKDLSSGYLENLELPQHIQKIIDFMITGKK